MNQWMKQLPGCDRCLRRRLQRLERRARDPLSRERGGRRLRGVRHDAGPAAAGDRAADVAVARADLATAAAARGAGRQRGAPFAHRQPGGGGGRQAEQKEEELTTHTCACGLGLKSATYFNLSNNKCIYRSELVPTIKCSAERRLS